MDTNNFVKKVGVGEREGRVFSQIVSQRHYGLSHGIGRSGELLAVQPKAAGSSLLQIVAHKMLASLIKNVYLFGGFKGLLVLPVATGMALVLCMMALRLRKPRGRKVVFLRIDQKSCVKSMLALGLEPLVVDNMCVESGQSEGRFFDMGFCVGHYMVCETYSIDAYKNDMIVGF